MTKLILVHPKHCIYVTYHATGKFYVGKGITKDVLSGKYRGSGVRLKSAFKKYPTSEWATDVIAMYEDEAAAFAQERLWVDEDLLMDPMCLNLHTGGRGGGNDELWSKTWRNPEFQSEMSRRGWDNPDVVKKQQSIMIGRWENGPLREQQRAGVNRTWQDEDYRKRMSICTSNRIKNMRWMNRDGVKKQVSLDKIDEFSAAGWKRGMK